MTIANIALAQGSAALIENACGAVRTVQDALDLMMTAKYETGCNAIILPKDALPEDFFVLRTGFAGEVLQKFVNYQMRVAIVGDFSGYTSKPLRDFIGESNRGNAVFFADTVEQAAQRLSRAR